MPKSKRYKKPSSQPQTLTKKLVQNATENNTPGSIATAIKFVFSAGLAGVSVMFYGNSNPNMLEKASSISTNLNINIWGGTSAVESVQGSYGEYQRYKNPTSYEKVISIPKWLGKTIANTVGAVWSSLAIALGGTAHALNKQDISDDNKKKEIAEDWISAVANAPLNLTGVSSVTGFINIHQKDPVETELAKTSQGKQALENIDLLRATLANNLAALQQSFINEGSAPHWVGPEAQQTLYQKGLDKFIQAQKSTRTLNSIGENQNEKQGEINESSLILNIVAAQIKETVLEHLGLNQSQLTQNQQTLKQEEIDILDKATAKTNRTIKHQETVVTLASINSEFIESYVTTLSTQIDQSKQLAHLGKEGMDDENIDAPTVVEHSGAAAASASTVDANTKTAAASTAPQLSKKQALNTSIASVISYEETKEKIKENIVNGLAEFKAKMQLSALMKEIGQEINNIPFRDVNEKTRWQKLRDGAFNYLPVGLIAADLIAGQTGYFCSATISLLPIFSLVALGWIGSVVANAPQTILAVLAAKALGDALYQNIKLFHNHRSINKPLGWALHKGWYIASGITAVGMALWSGRTSTTLFEESCSYDWNQSTNSTTPTATPIAAPSEEEIFTKVFLPGLIYYSGVFFNSIYAKKSFDAFQAAVARRWSNPAKSNATNLVLVSDNLELLANAFGITNSEHFLKLLNRLDEETLKNLFGTETLKKLRDPRQVEAVKSNQANGEQDSLLLNVHSNGNYDIEKAETLSIKGLIGSTYTFFKNTVAKVSQTASSAIQASPNYGSNTSPLRVN